MSEKKTPGVLIIPFPPSPPPSIVPHYSIRLSNQITYMIRNCLYTYVYIWTKNDGSFWIYLTSYASSGKLSGYQWDRNFWKSAELDCSQIDSFF